MKLLRFLRFALIGLISGILFTVLMGLIWPAIFPGILRAPPGATEPPLSLSTTIQIVLFIISLPALIGGLIGGILSREGGSRDQTITAALGGIIASVPFSCFNFWILSG